MYRKENSQFLLTILEHSNHELPEAELEPTPKPMLF